MNVAEITMAPREARAKLAEYRDGLRRRADAEYSAARDAYRELAKGRALLNLADAFAAAPLDDKGRPRLAIARGHEPEVQLTMFSNDPVIQFDTGWPRNRFSTDRTRTRVTVPYPSPNWRQGYALVPIVPPSVRRHHALRECHVLWEVERWADKPTTAAPDRDPYLLRHLGGDLWVVLGAWDLTDVERAIMGQRIVQ